MPRPSTSVSSRQTGTGSSHSKLTLECLERRELLSAAPSSVTLPALQTDPQSYDQTHILVRFRSGISDLEINSVLPGATVRPELGLVDGLREVRLPAGASVDEALSAYRKEPFVLYAQPDYVIHASGMTNDPLVQDGTQWALSNRDRSGSDTGATRAWDIACDNATTVVAVIDSGIDYTHPDLAGQIWTNAGEIPGDGADNDHNGYIDDMHGYDFVNNDPDPMDDFYHGTHIAGIIGATGNNGKGGAGVAQDVRLMPLKFLNANGSGTTSDAILALNYAVSMGARIVNNSWNGGPFNQTLADAIQAAGRAGVLFVASAGNNGANTDSKSSYPASYALDNIISVAATDRTDQYLPYSNYGAQSVDLAAPGKDILSTVPRNGYKSDEGTSMAAAEVSGAAALLWSSDPSLSVAEVKHRLLAGADPIGQVGNNSSRPTGTNGRLNVYNAIQPDLCWTTIESPAAVLTGQTFSVTTNYRVSGSSIRGEFRIAYYLSRDGVFGNADDVLLATQNVTGAPGRAVGQLKGTGPDLRIRATGTYTLFVRLDDGGRIKEFDENNNVSRGLQIQVTDKPVLYAQDVQIVEGNDGTKTAVFTVSLSAASDRPVTVEYATVSGSARAGYDFATRKGKLTFAPGQCRQTVLVPIWSDKRIEKDETLFLELRKPTHAEVATPRVTARIVNDDGMADESSWEDGKQNKTASSSIRSSSLAGDEDQSSALGSLSATLRESTDDLFTDSDLGERLLPFVNGARYDTRVGASWLEDGFYADMSALELLA